MTRGLFQRVDEIEAQRATLTVWAVFLAGTAVTTFVAILAPDDVLTRNAWLKSVVDEIASVILFIDIFAAISAFPECARLVIAIGWCLVPFQCAFLLAGGAYRRGWERFRDRPVFMTVLFVLLLAAFVLPAIFWIGPEITARHLESSRRLRGAGMSAALRLAAGDRFFLGAISGVVTSIMAWILGYVLTWMRHIPYIYFGANRPGR